MATIDDIITEARYDLRDTGSTLYTDDELIHYANRALRQLDNVLSAKSSDWILDETNLTLSAGNNYTAVPSDAMVVRDAWIGSNQLTKKPPQYIYQERKYITATGRPLYFADSGTNMIFEMAADQDYTITVYYDKRSPLLSTGSAMPYNDEFNDPIREMIVLLAHKRQEAAGVMTDSQIFDYFMDQVIGNVVRRNSYPRSNRLDF